MSALRSIDVTQPPGSGAVVQVPKSYMPEMDKALLDANPRQMDFPASAGSFVPGSLSQILVPPTANRYILGGTAYLNFDFVLSVIASGTFTTASAQSYFTGGPTKSAAALIDRLTITAAGTTIADISNYYIWHNIILTHAANQDYQLSSQIMENSFSCIDLYTAAQTQTSPTLNIALPLAVGVFNTTKAFPLWAFSGPIVINIYWSSFARSIGFAPQGSAGAYVTDANATGNLSFAPSGNGWAGSNLSLRCLCTDVDPEYIMEQRKQMAGGKMLVFQYDQAMGMQTGAGSASINFGINCSSLLGVVGCQLMSADTAQLASSLQEAPGAASDTSSAQTFAGSWGYSANDTDSIRVFRDGTQMTSFPLMQGRRDDAFPVLTETLGILFSTSNGTIARHFDPRGNVPSHAANNKADPCVSTVGSRRFNLPPLWGLTTLRGGSVHSPAAVVWGVPSRKCSDDNISNQGVYCQMLQLIVDRSTTNNAAGTHYLFYLFSSALAIDISGNCVVKR